MLMSICAYFEKKKIFFHFERHLLGKAMTTEVLLNFLQESAYPPSLYAYLLEVEKLKRRADEVDHRTLPRKRPAPTDFTKTLWWQMLQHSNLKIPDSIESKLFTRRFRVPFPVFEDLVAATKGWLEGLGQKEQDCTGLPRIPVELKVLGCLRILGSGTCLDGIKELSGISETTMHTFFHAWCAWVRQDLFPHWVHLPETKQEIAAAMGPYAALALNGTIGSVDAVHLHCGKCPAANKNACTGKEGSFFLSSFLFLIFLKPLK